MIYSSSINPRTDQEIFPALEPGSELGWAPVAKGTKPFGISETYFQYVIFKNPQWSFRNLNYGHDVDGTTLHSSGGRIPSNVPTCRPC